MELPGLLKLKQKDLWALVVFCMLGVLAACVIPDPTWAVYASILVAFHCFVGWLIFVRDGRVKRPLPVYALVLIHVFFMVVVVVLVSVRQSIPRFGLLPLPLVAIGFSILSTAAGREQQDDKFSGPRRRKRAKRLQNREVSRKPAQAKPAASATIAATTEARAEAPLPVPQSSAPQDRSQGQPAPAAAQPQPAPDTPHPNGAVVAEQAPPPIKAYEPVAPGVVLSPFPPRNGAQPEPQFFRDTSIAESIRQKHSDDLARLNPILAATAEDHEEWLKERGSHNPTHRKIGMTVREEYEQWLMARALARSSPQPAEANAPARQP